MGKFFCFFIINSRKTDTERDGAPHKDVRGSPKRGRFLSFFLFVCDFICEICCSIHPPTRRCVCCFYLYLYLYLYLFVFVFVFEVVDARDGRCL